MYAHKEDEETRRHMALCDYLRPEKGSHTPCVGWNPVYVRSDGHMKPYLYINEFGRSKEEQKRDDDVHSRFEGMASGDGAEEDKIRNAFKKHQEAMDTHLKSKMTALVEVTALNIQKGKLEQEKNALDTEMEAHSGKISAQETKQILNELFVKVGKDVDEAITLLKQLTAVAQVQKKVSEIAEKVVA
eukprot:SAG11_NODE_14776_length_599_cov_595.388000_1_plen_186_part_10